MILHLLTHGGTHAFAKGPIAIDFDALPPLVGVHGPNGAGKTTLFDAVVAALYLVMPFRPGALHRNFLERGGIGLTWSIDGCRYYSDVRVDPEAERTEARLFDAASNVLIAGPLVRDYRRAVEQIAGPLDTFIASGYAVQNGAGAFLRMARPERKALLTDLLGLQVFPRYEAAAKERAARTAGDVDRLRGRIADLEARTGQRAALAAKRDDIAHRLDVARDRLEAAHAAQQTAQAQLTEAREARAAVEPLRAEVARLEGELKDLAQQLLDADARRANNAKLLDRAAEIRNAAARSQALGAELAGVQAEIAAGRLTHQAAVQAAHAATLARQTAAARHVTAVRDRQRADRQLEILGTVPCHGDGDFSGCQFLKDARAAADALPSLAAEIAAAEQALQTIAVPDTPADPTTALARREATLKGEIQQLKPTVDLAGPLDVARARLEELDARIAQVAQDIATRTTRRTDLLATLEQLPALTEAVNLAQQAANAADVQRRQAQQDIVVLERDLGGVDAQLADVAAADAALTDARAAMTPLTTDLADWTLLAKAFSASGIPALLIDQALPEIGRLATELLRECYGEQVFTIALTTQRESADGEKLLETLDVLVTRGGEAIDAALLSGGESVLVSESVSLAIALYNATRSGRRIQTLLRDEVSAPLDIERAPAYVRMLRRAAQLGNFRHVLFVSHQPPCLELADARLRVAGGAVTVE